MEIQPRSNDCLPYERGRGRIRTAVGGFADPCLTTRPRDLVRIRFSFSYKKDMCDSYPGHKSSPCTLVYQISRQLFFRNDKARHLPHRRIIALESPVPGLLTIGCRARLIKPWDAFAVYACTNKHICGKYC